MKKLIPLLSLALLGPLASATAFAQGTVLEAKVEFEHTTYDSAFFDAAENYNGDLLIYFYQHDSGNHHDVLSQALNEQTLAQFMNENFARIAVDTATPEGQEVLALFRSDLPAWSFIVVQRTGERAHVGMHG